MAWFGRKTATTQTPRSFSENAGFQDRVLEIGTRLLTGARQHRGGFFSASFWSDQLMAWTMKDPAFRTQLFRFIDVFPMLRTPEQIHDYLTDYLSQPGVTLPPGLDLGLKAGGLAKGLVAKTIADRIAAMAGNFIAGADATAALPVLRDLWKQGVAFSVDLLGEACVSEEEAAGLPAALSRSARSPAGGSRQLAGRAAAGERSPRPRAADERFDQDQRAEPSHRCHRLRGLAADAWRPPWSRSSAKRPSGT